MISKYFQENYSEEFSHCFGCGTNNKYGHKLKTYWEGDETVSKFSPKPEHTAIPGFVYGGLIASLIDCHSTGSGAAALYKNQSDKNKEYPRCVTASLKVEYLKPTPIDCELELRGSIKEVKEKKVIVDVNLFAKNKLCAKGEVIVIKVSEGWQPKQ